MKSSEIRVGNYVDNNGSHVKVTQIGLDTISYIETNDSIGGTLYQCQGIPITQDWLSKSGFKLTVVNDRVLDLRTFKSEIEEMYEFEKFTIKVTIFKSGCIDVHDGWMQRNWIKYVHQLQNYYYAIANEELPI